eukprot:TRINITY_DN2138_c0_g1_i4.p1 TRINITY_DN2138_c0_g1~~TRINITY_DN2138_c0_g1_i4.p1  ORF type:complete len:583 (+),score=61.55 TRINITY_DN2138_c0_g1_i4:174-1922(+)
MFILSKFYAGIFSNIDAILALNLILLTRLEERVDAWSNQQNIGDIFVHMAPHLKMYSKYCNNYDHAVALLDLYSNTYNLFADFLRTCRDFPEAKSLSLHSFLIMPVQRTPRYIMLLADLHANTWESHSDYADITLGREGMEHIADHIDTELQVANTVNTFLRLQKNAGVDVSNLIKAHRVVVKEGRLKRILSLEKRKLLILLLFNDLLIIAGIKKKGKFKKKLAVLPFAGLWFKDCEDSENFPASFYIVGPFETYHVAGEDNTEKGTWLTLLQDTVDQYKSAHPKVGAREGNIFRDPYLLSQNSTLKKIPSFKSAQAEIKQVSLIRPFLGGESASADFNGSFSARAPRRKRSTVAASGIEASTRQSSIKPKTPKRLHERERRSRLSALQPAAMAKVNPSTARQAKDPTTPETTTPETDAPLSSSFLNLIARWEEPESDRKDWEVLQIPCTNSANIGSPAEKAEKVHSAPSSPSPSHKPNLPKRKRPNQASAMSGYLMKKGRVNRQWKRRYCKLVCGQLLYFKAMEDNNPTGVLPLKGTKVSTQSNRKYQHAFSIFTAKRTFSFHAATQQEKDEWVKALSNVI